MAFVEEPTEAESGAPAATSQNRTFIILAAALGGLFVIGLICIGVYAFVFGPQQRHGQETQVAFITTQNAKVAADEMTRAAVPTTTPPSLVETASAEDTQRAINAGNTETPVVAATDTLPPPATNTPVPIALVTNTPTPTEGASATPTALGTSLTPTKGTPPTATPLVGSLTRTTTPAARTPTPTQLPGTGFADQAGVPGLILLGFALVAVVIVARRLRLSLR